LKSIRFAVIKFSAVRLAALAALLILGAATARPAGRDIYPDPAQAKADLAAALRTAAQTHKRIILDFGGNWCGDCQVLDIYFHNAQNLPLLESNFVVVHVNIGRSARACRRWPCSASAASCSTASGPASSNPCGGWTRLR